MIGNNFGNFYSNSKIRLRYMKIKKDSATAVVIVRKSNIVTVCNHSKFFGPT